jgi:hypothetical protein
MVDSDFSPRKYWTDDFGDRAFWFDAFVSHNRGDGSEALIHRLSAAGARISSDHAGAPEGWPFPTFLFGHLSSSRCVVVSVSQEFRLSPWIRAEINVARRVQERSGLDRLFTAVSDSSHHIPLELAGYPVFDVSSAEGLQDLASRLMEMNRLPAEMLDVRSNLKRETSHARLGEAAQALRARLDARPMLDARDESTLWWLAGDTLVDARGQLRPSGQSTSLLEVVTMLRASGVLVPAEFGAELIAVVQGMLAAGAYNIDERVRLLRLLAMAACGQAEYLDGFLDCLAAETHEAVAKEMLRWVQRAGGPNGSDPRVAMTVLVATDISGLGEGDIEHLSTGLPEAVLARLQVLGEPNVDLAELSAGERLNIAAMEMSGSLQSGSSLEIWLRNLAGLITAEYSSDDEWSWAPLNTETHTLVTCCMALTSIDWFIAYSKQHDGFPLVSVDPDPTLWPILFSALHFPDLSDYARGVADRLEAFFSEQARKADLPSDFVDYSGLLRAIFTNWSSPESIRRAVRAWKIDALHKHAEQERLRALRAYIDDPDPEI